MEESIMSFSEALTLVKEGKKLSRRGWNGKDMFIFKVDGSKFTVNRPPLNTMFPEGTEVEYRPHIDMKYADGSIGVWLASHGDMFGEDWFIVS